MLKLVSTIGDIFYHSPGKIALVTTYTGEEKRVGSFYKSLNGKNIIISADQLKDGNTPQGHIFEIEDVNLNNSFSNSLIISILITSSKDFKIKSGMFIYHE